MQHIAVWSLVLTSCLCLVNGCSVPHGWHPMTEEEYVLKTQALVYGRVLRTFRTLTDRLYNTYTAEVRVYCSFKGPQMPETVNFTRVGAIPGMCYSTQLEQGRTYAILVDWIPDEGQDWTPFQTWQADDAKIQQLVRTCGLHTQYPEGLDESVASWTCPAAAPADQCLDQEYFDSQRARERVRGGGARGGGKNRVGGSRLRRPQSPVARKLERSFWTE